MPPVPTITASRTAILSELKEALKVGGFDVIPVSDFWVWFFDLDDFITFFKRTDADEINGWEFDMVDIDSEEDTEGNRFFLVVQWKLWGYYGVKQSTASSKKLSDQIQLVIDRFAFNVPVFGIPERVERSPRCIYHVERGRIEKGEHNVWSVECFLKTEHIMKKP